MSVDLYSPRAMAQALLQMKPPRTFLRELLGRREEYYTTEFVDVDVKTGQRRMAPFVNPRGVGKQVDRIGFTTSTLTPPLVAPKRALTANDLQKRMPGETIYGTQTPDERAAMLLGQDLAELDETISRREEWMVARAAFDSAITVVGDDVSQSISYARSAAVQAAAPGSSAANGLGTDSPTSTKLTNARLWTADTADIVPQIRQMRRLGTKLTGLNMTDLILGEAAADALVNAPSLKGLTGALNTRNLDLGLIKPELLEGGATYYGQFAGTGVNIWGYDEWFVDPADDTEKPMVPPKMALMVSRDAYSVMRYGGVGVATGFDQSSQLALVAGKRIPESWIEKEPPVRFLKISSRPVFVPVQNDAFITCQVVA